MHVRHEGQNLHVGWSRGRPGFDLEIVGVRWNDQPSMIRCLLSDHNLLNGFVGLNERQAQPAEVLLWGSDRRVMKLESEL